MIKKVLFVVDERQMGGVSTVLNDLLHLLDRSELKIDVLVLHDRGNQLQALPSDITLRYGSKYFIGIDYTIKEAMKTKNISVIYRKIKIVFDMKTTRVLSNIKRQRRKMELPQYDIEIAFKDGFTSIFTAAGNSSKKIHWLHYEYHESNPNVKYGALFNEILPKFDVIVGVSENVVKAFNNIYHLDEKSIVIPNVVNEKRIIDLSVKEVTNNLQENKLNFVSVGRLHEVKAYDRLLKVLTFAEIKKYHSYIHVDIYGDGPEKFRLKQLINDLNLQDIVTLKGKIDNPYAVVKYYDANLVVSRFEAFGLSIIESMLLNVPVLATRTAAVDTLICDGVNGLICDNNEEAIVKMLCAVCDNSTVLKDMKEKLSDYTYPNITIINQIETLLMGGKND